MEFYAQRYQHCLNPNTIRLDATPDYLTFPERIIESYTEANALDTVKFMVVLREPVSRELSLYNHAHYYNKDLPQTFEEYAETKLLLRLTNPNMVNHHTGNMWII